MKSFYFLPLFLTLVITPYVFCEEESEANFRSEDSATTKIYTDKKASLQQNSKETFWDIYNQRSKSWTFVRSFLTTQGTIFLPGLIGAGLVSYAKADKDTAKFIGIIAGGIGSYVGHTRINPQFAEYFWKGFIKDASRKLNMSQPDQAFNVNIKQELEATKLSIDAATTAEKEQEMFLASAGSWTAIGVDVVAVLIYTIYRYNN